MRRSCRWPAGCPRWLPPARHGRDMTRSNSAAATVLRAANSMSAGVTQSTTPPRSRAMSRSPCERCRAGSGPISPPARPGPAGPMSEPQSNRRDRSERSWSRARTEFVAQVSRRSSCSRNWRDKLEHLALVTPWAARACGRRPERRRSPPRSSMNSTTSSSSATQGERFPQGGCQACRGSRPRSRDGYSSSATAEPSRAAAPLAKVVLPVPGGPNKTMARGGTRPEPVGQLRLGQRQDRHCRSIASVSRTMPPS